MIPMNLAEFERLDTPDKVELLNGELVQTPPAHRRHNKSADRLFLLLSAALDLLRNATTGPAYEAHRDMGYLLAGDPPSWLEPDVSITRADHPGDRYYEGAPLMAFEIVSEHDRAGELDRKVSEYRANGSAEVWVIYPETRHAVVYHGSQDATLETNSIHSELLPGVEIPFAGFLN